MFFLRNYKAAQLIESIIKQCGVFFNHRNLVYLCNNKYRTMKEPTHHLQENALLPKISR